MKAAQIFKYNKQNISTQLVEIEKPQPEQGEVLVRVMAAGVNPLDNMITRGEVKLITPYPMPLTMGNELAGIVEAVGEDVTAFKAGDKVFGRLPLGKIGAFAEWATVDTQALTLIPEGYSFVEAASIPLVALTAYQALDLLQATAGKSIFISGASGGLGAMAIPLAKARGLIVYASGNAQSRERMMTLGADYYYDYKTEDYHSLLPKMDYIIDSLGGAELSKQIQHLKAGGSIVSLKGMPNGAFAQRLGLPWWKRMLFSLAGASADKAARKQGAIYHFLFVEANGSQLTEIANIITERGIRPSVNKVYPFTEVNMALNALAQGGSTGKVVLSME